MLAAPGRFQPYQPSCESIDKLISVARNEFDNVVVDDMGPADVAAEFADIRLGPGAVNFMPGGMGVTVTDNRTGSSSPRACTFPKLPAPEPPKGWLR